MPSVGGGGHGGGSHGGGSFHGGSGGHGYNGHPYRRGYYYGGMYVPLSRRGRFGTMFGFPLLWLVLCVFIFGIMFWGMFKGDASYSESTFEDYALEQYEDIYPDNKYYEDNLLVCILTHEDDTDEGYDYISIVGDNVNYSINLEFGDKYTQFGGYLERYMPKAYNTSNFDEALIYTTNSMAQAISDMALSSNFKSATGTNSNTGRVILNPSYISNFNESSVESALASFKETTGLTLTYVITDYNKVMKLETEDLFIVVIMALIFIGIGVGLLVKNITAYKAIKKAEDNGTVNQYYKDEDGHPYQASSSSNTSSSTNLNESGEWDINPDDFK